MSKSGCVGLSASVSAYDISGAETLSQLIKGRLSCPNLETISVLRNVLHHNNDNVGKTGNTWLTALYSDLLSVWQSVLHMMFGSHKQFQHGRVRCQDNSHIIRHCRTSMWLAKKIQSFYLESLTSPCFLPIVSLRRAVLSFETWSLPLHSEATSAHHEWDEVWEGPAWGTAERKERTKSWSTKESQRGENPKISRRGHKGALTFKLPFLIWSPP